MLRIGYRLFSRSTGLRIAGFFLALPFVLASVRAAFFRGPVLPPEPLPNTPLIDMHCHVAGIGKNGSGCFVSSRLLKSWKFRFYLRAFGLSRHEIEQSGDEICASRVAETLAAS